MQTQPVPRGSAPCGRADPPPVGARDGAAPGSVASISDAHRGYLDAAVARCRLPIAVAIGSWHGGLHLQFTVEALDREPFGRDDIVLTLTPDWRDATRAYLDLCRSLSAPGSSPVVGADTAAGASL